MASKTWDAYMKIHGMSNVFVLDWLLQLAFLSSVLEPVLSDILKSKRSCEVRIHNLLWLTRG